MNNQGKSLICLFTFINLLLFFLFSLSFLHVNHHCQVFFFKFAAQVFKSFFFVVLFAVSVTSTKNDNHFSRSFPLLASFGLVAPLFSPFSLLSPLTLAYCHNSKRVISFIPYLAVLTVVT